MSPQRPDARWRRITPHAFGSDGLRWHVRGYCHLDGDFKDFVLSRWRGLRGQGKPGVAAAADRDWTETFTVELQPNPMLSPRQREAVAWEYDMLKGRTTLPVQRALLYYLKKRLRLDVAVDSPDEAPVVVANRDAFEVALADAWGQVHAGV